MGVLTLSVTIAVLYVAHAVDQRLEIDLKSPVMDISPMLWGIFFEEINHAGDGGIYAEMVQNRAFETTGPYVPANISLYRSLLPAVAVSSGTPVYIRHCDYQGYATPIQSDLDRSDSSFALVKGLDGKNGTISFFSLNYPNYYLIPKDMRMVLTKNDGTEDFSDSASFYQRPGLSDSSMSSFESASLTGYFMTVTER
jgi:hypothetical protein